MITGWYYQRNGHSTGPVTDAEIQREIAAGRIDGRTPVWHEAMPDWLELGDTELVRLLKVPLNEEALSAQIGNFNRLYSAYWIVLGCAAAATLAALGILAATILIARADGWDWSAGWIAATLGVAGGTLGSWIAVKILWAILLYQASRSIPPECADTTPGRAVGFLFIPVFNWYWVYIAVADLAKSLNAQMQREKIRAPLVSEGVCRGFCIAYSLQLLILPIPVAVVLGCMVPAQLRRGCLAIWKNRLRQRLADLRRAEQLEKQHSREE